MYPECILTAFGYEEHFQIWHLKVKKNLQRFYDQKLKILQEKNYLLSRWKEAVFLSSPIFLTSPIPTPHSLGASI